MAVDPLKKFVLKPGLVQPGHDWDKAILENDALLEEIAGLWIGHEKAITALIKSRMYAIEQEMIAEIVPEELLIYRQAMVEIAIIGDDFKRYAEEWRRRKHQRESEHQDDPEPPAEQPEEASSL